MIAVAWNEPVIELSERLERIMGAVSAEAAVAIERAALLERLERMTRTDDLTGLMNRRAWDQELERELVRAARDGKPLAIAMLDLDRFKSYNDRLGHQAGDRLLKQAASGWRAALRETDMLARYGGEEFAIAMPGCDPETGGGPGRAPALGDARRRVLLGRPGELGRQRIGGGAARPRRRGPVRGEADRSQPSGRLQGRGSGRRVSLSRLAFGTLPRVTGRQPAG